MIAIRCKSCNSGDIEIRNRTAVCRSCGTRYFLESHERTAVAAHTKTESANELPRKASSKTNIRNREGARRRFHKLWKYALAAILAIMLLCLDKSRERTARLDYLQDVTGHSSDEIERLMQFDMTDKDIIQFYAEADKMALRSEIASLERAQEQYEYENNRRRILEEQAIRKEQEEEKRAERAEKEQAERETYEAMLDEKYGELRKTGQGISLDDAWELLSAPNPYLEKDNAAIEAKMAQIEEERLRKQEERRVEAEETAIPSAVSAQSNNPVHPVVDGSGFNELRIGEQYRGDVYYQTENRGSRMEGFDEFYYVNEH